MAIKKKLLGRAGVDPVIGHMKADHRLGRNFLLELRGYQFNGKRSGNPTSPGRRASRILRLG